jgi:hypothetical protein
MYQAISFSVILALVLSGCVGGINPADYAGNALLRGTVRYVRGAGASNFPPKDSLFELRVVVFKQIPRDTNLVQTLANGDAFFSASLLDTAYAGGIPFSVEIPQAQIADSSVMIRYVAVGQQYGKNIFSDWRVVGVYSSDSVFTPKSIRATPGLVINDMIIDVDFLRIPPQPFIR